MPEQLDFWGVGMRARGAGTKVKFLLRSLLGIPEATTTLATTSSAYSSGKTGGRGDPHQQEGLMGLPSGDTGVAHCAQSWGLSTPAAHQDGMRGWAETEGCGPGLGSPRQTARPSPDPQCHNYCNVSGTRVHMSLRRFCQQDFGE